MTDSFQPNPNFPFVASLSSFDRKSLAVVAGKGANLGELIKARDLKSYRGSPYHYHT